jgi:hypothetical protein
MMRFQSMNERRRDPTKSTQRPVRACARVRVQATVETLNGNTNTPRLILTYSRGQVVSLSRACNKRPIGKLKGRTPIAFPAVTGESLRCDSVNVYKDERQGNARANDWCLIYAKLRTRLVAFRGSSLDAVLKGH